MAHKVNLPGLFYKHLLRAVAYGQLGEREAASKALQELLAMAHNFDRIARAELGKWYLPELVEHLIEGLRKADLEIAKL